MKILVRALILGAVLCLASGCGKSSALQAAEAYQQEACITCKDKKCVEQAAVKFTDAVQGRPVTASSAEAEAFSKAKVEALACAAKLPEASSAPSTGSAASAGPPRGAK